MYKEELYKHQEAQKWWLSKSLLNFKQLNNFNINLEVIKTNSFQIFFDKLIKSRISQFIGIKFTNQTIYLILLNALKNKKIYHKRCKGNALNEIDEIKNDGSPFKVFTPFWRAAEKHYIEKYHQERRLLKRVKKINYFKNCIGSEKILPKKDWFKNFEKIWFRRTKSLKELQNFIKDRIANYSEGRNYPNTLGTSKLSPFIKFGQLHVETIWDEVKK